MSPEDGQRGGEGLERYKLRPHMTELELPLISCGVDAVLSPNRGKIVDALENGKLKPRTPPRESLTALDDLSESLSVIRVLGDWFAKVPSLTSPIVDRQRNMMRRDGASYCWSTSLDRFHSGARCGVLKYDP